MRQKRRSIIILGLLILVLLSLGIYEYERYRSNTPEPKTKKLVNTILHNMVYVHAGSYIMDPWGNPHKVTLTSFYMSNDNTSYGEFDTYTEILKETHIQNGYRVLGRLGVQSEYTSAFFRAANYPVNQISWDMANDYCQWLAKTTGLPFDLPTEAQWVYVASNFGDKWWKYPTDNGLLEIGKNFPDEYMYTHQKGNVGGDPLPMPVGSIPCTPLHICGLTGQVKQWIKDWYSEDYYKNTTELNPQGPTTGNYKVLKGLISPGNEKIGTTNFYRSFDTHGSEMAGFRCVINSGESIQVLQKFAYQHIIKSLS